MNVGEGLGTIHQLDQTFVPDRPENEFPRHEPVVEIPDPDTYQRKMPYLANWHTLPTNLLPTMAGLQ